MEKISYEEGMPIITTCRYGKILAMKKVDTGKKFPKKGCVRNTPPPTYSNFV
jgi:hypothetical protein